MRLSSFLLAFLIVLAGCTKPKLLVVTLKPESPDASEVRHTLISLRSNPTTLVLKMEILNPAEFVDYTATLARGMNEKVASDDHLSMAGDNTVRLDVEVGLATPGSYLLVLQGTGKDGKLFPVGKFSFEIVK